MEVPLIMFYFWVSIALRRACLDGWELTVSLTPPIHEERTSTPGAKTSTEVP
jgi:hypothetical protein